MIIVMLDKGIPPIPRDSLDSVSGVTVIDAYANLASRLPSYNNRAFLRAYAHWRGDPPMLVDDHPNAEAHRLVAEMILLAVETLPL